MRALKLGLIALAVCVGAARANYRSDAAGTVTNGSTATGSAVFIAGSTSVTYAATFTASSVGTTSLAFEVSWDGATWYPWLSTSLGNTTGANVRGLPVVASGTSVLVVPGVYGRVKLTNNTGASITLATVGVVAN